uniref:Uncharacterized protein n=1 Tax=Sphaerodactylus townsendi TaxID=933632 RepID=A0ACB8FXH9_9SAUR
MGKLCKAFQTKSILGVFVNCPERDLGTGLGKGKNRYPIQKGNVCKLYSEQKEGLFARKTSMPQSCMWRPAKSNPKLTNHHNVYSSYFPAPGYVLKPQINTVIV